MYDVFWGSHLKRDYAPTGKREDTPEAVACYVYCDGLAFPSQMSEWEHFKHEYC